ncbi:L-lactate permease [Clostridium sp. chh4-2]|uniref:L-lactate permease n=1 Tax=Clostridium sp. chh4-2 TaxID=2067550 RepID=UPI000CCEFE84|nr:L-lactate permease [Clostridium sp. chh4-2]PNV59858.1 L-lactate permease [Clostridium sp. chh4-2]
MTGFLLWAGAAAPIVILFLAMSILQMKTEKAALLGLAVSGLAAVTLGMDSFANLFINLTKGAWSAVSILIVIWPAIVLYEILQRTGAFETIKKLAIDNSKDQLFLILLFCWLFSSFLQGITGFGVPVAVCAPLLIAIGVTPGWAVVITLIGHAWANTFGTFALAWEALITQSGLTDIGMTLVMTCCFLWAVDFAGGVLICAFYGGKRAVSHMMPFLVIISMIHGGGQLAAGFMNTTIAAFLPTTIALGAAAVFLKCGYYREAWSLPSRILKEPESGGNAVNGNASIGLALLPFGLLVCFSVVILMVKPVNLWLGRLVLQLSFPATETGRGFVNEATGSFGPLHILTHAGFILFLSVSVTWMAFLKKGILHGNDASAVMKGTLKKTVPASLGILLLVMMAQVLRGSGLMEIIAQGVTAAAGRLYGMAAPFIGILGAFVTSSNTSSNILLGSFQAAMASALHINSWIILAAQTVGGAIGTIVGPSTILLGTTTAGCRGKEGWVLKKMLPLAVTEVFFVGIITLILSFAV